MTAPVKFLKVLVLNRVCKREIFYINGQAPLSGTVARGTKNTGTIREVLFMVYHTGDRPNIFPVCVRTAVPNRTRFFNQISSFTLFTRINCITSLFPS